MGSVEVFVSLETANVVIALHEDVACDALVVNGDEVYIVFEGHIVWLVEVSEKVKGVWVMSLVELVDSG